MNFAFNSWTRIVFSCLMIVTASMVQPADAQQANQLFEKRVLAAADRKLGPRFNNISDFCRRGVLPWTSEAKIELKNFLKLLYQHNWLASMFDDHDMRMTSTFSDAMMHRYLGQTISNYDEKSIRFLFFNINRCRKLTKLDDNVFANLRYILNHHYPGLDMCLSSDNSARAKCALHFSSTQLRGMTHESELRAFYSAAARINLYYRERDEHRLWLDMLYKTWLSTSTQKAFRRQSAKFDLPVVNINFVLLHADQVITHFEALKRQ